MSVASKNPFALLDEGAEDRSSTPAAPAPSQPAPAPAKDTKKTQQKGPRGGQYYSRGGARNSATRGEGNPNQNGVDEPEVAPRKFEGGRGRGRGGSRGGARGGRDGGGRRPFDKHSASGKTDSDKKIHQGWGGDDGNTELQAEAAATVDAAAEQTGADAWGASGGDSAAAWDAPTGDASAPAAATEDKPAREGRPPREVEEEDNTLTLDQYLAQKKEVLPKPKTRQAYEGDTSGEIWKDAVPLQKNDEDAYFAGKTKNAPKARAKKEEKVYLEIDGRFDRPARGGRGRGGDMRGRGDSRGRGGRGGRGGPRGGAGRPNNGTNQADVNVDDEAAFPSLS